MEKYLVIARKAIAATVEGSFHADVRHELDERNELSSKIKSRRTAPPSAPEDRTNHTIDVVELVFVEPREKVTPISPDFPPCPDCASTRYWISNFGKVVCGKCGETRFILASISYHAVN